MRLFLLLLAFVTTSAVAQVLQMNKSFGLFDASVCADRQTAMRIAQIAHKKGGLFAGAIFTKEPSCTRAARFIKPIKLIGFFGEFKVIEVISGGEVLYLITTNELQGLKVI